MIFPQAVNGLKHDHALQLPEFICTDGSFAFFIPFTGGFKDHFGQTVPVEAVQCFPIKVVQAKIKLFVHRFLNLV